MRRCARVSSPPVPWRAGGELRADASRITGTQVAEFTSQVAEMEPQVAEIDAQLAEIPPQLAEKHPQVAEKIFLSPMVSIRIVLQCAGSQELQPAAGSY